MSNQENDTYLSTAEAARALNVSRSWLEKCRVRGEGPPYFKIGRRRVLYSRRELATWLDAHLVQPEGALENSPDGCAISKSGDRKRSRLNNSRTDIVPGSRSNRAALAGAVRGEKRNG